MQHLWGKNRYSCIPVSTVAYIFNLLNSLGCGKIIKRIQKIKGLSSARDFSTFGRLKRIKKKVDHFIINSEVQINVLSFSLNKIKQTNVITYF